MEYIRLGKSDLHISRISFGTMSLPAVADSETIIGKAIDQGINFFDTADLYQQGANESMLGRALGSRRKDVLIASKVGNVARPDGGLAWNPSRKHILTSIDESLQRLRTDYIDLYQLHGGTIEDDMDETIGAFEELRILGKIRYYGISSIRPNVIQEYLKRAALTSVMLQYSLLDRRPEEGILSLLEKNQVGVLVRGALAKGLLIDKTAAPYLNHSTEDVRRIAEGVNRFSNDVISKTALAIQFVLKETAVTAAVVGIRTLEQLNEAVEADGLRDIKIATALSALAPVNFYTDHRH